MNKSTKKPKTGRGGARTGAGRKKNETKGEPVKEPASIGLYPEQKAAIIAEYGSLQAWADAHIPVKKCQGHP